MAVHPRTQRRAVLEEEEQAQNGERKPEYDRRQTPDPVDDTFGERGDDVGHVRLHRRVGTRRTRLVDSCARQPPLRFVGRRTRVLPDLPFLTGDAADHDHDDEDAERHESEQHDDGSGGARHVRRKLCDKRHRNCCDDCRGNYGAYDRGGRGEQPDHSGEEREDPDEQPGSPTEVTEPARRGEDRRESLQLDDAYFGPVGADRDAVVLVSAVLREAHSHGFLLRTTTAFSFELRTRADQMHSAAALRRPRSSPQLTRPRCRPYDTPRSRTPSWTACQFSSAWRSRSARFKQRAGASLRRRPARR